MLRLQYTDRNDGCGLDVPQRARHAAQPGRLLLPQQQHCHAAYPGTCRPLPAGGPSAAPSCTLKSAAAPSLLQQRPFSKTAL